MTTISSAFVEKATPGDYLLFADAYHSAARTLFEQVVEYPPIKMQGLGLHHLLPGLTLLSLSIELSLKGFLLGRGKSGDWLKKRIGHDIKEAFKRAKAHGILDHDKTLGGRIEAEQIDYLNGLYKTHALRYPAEPRLLEGDPQFLALSHRILMACARASGVDRGLVALVAPLANNATNVLQRRSAATSGAGFFDYCYPPAQKIPSVL